MITASKHGCKSIGCNVQFSCCVPYMPLWLLQTRISPGDPQSACQQMTHQHICSYAMLYSNFLANTYKRCV